ncbi:hypothetical protein DEU56DRAFT_765077 [Suillus clintonianus]|uniref:uncharacterized protein n=1 Tax=Suillus clintonianus TaxID=1904413 RepID=UPI001B863F13|nr:uncharacterized protein DEU56DRAFT_765077 [Suillus clintonianus]KAG2157522.1 hypothetical protein DEU56DRAFT_765077 [Suillus clintonianus]
MLGVDLRWDRLRWAYEFDVAMRTKSASTLNGLSQAEKNKAQCSFEPGEIAHVDGGGGVTTAFYEFLDRSKFPLTSMEQRYVRVLIDTAPDISKYCLVLQRLSADTFIVCYIASFGGVIHGTGLSPITRFFSMAMGDTPPWPPNSRPLHVVPRWIGSGFVFGVPVVRKNLSKTTHSRASLAHGELQRVRSFIAKRLKLFQQVNEELRAKDREWHKFRKKTGIKIDSQVDFTVMLDEDHPSRVACDPTIPSEVPAPGDVAECSNFKSMLRMKRDIKVPSLHKHRFLDVPPSNHLAWLLRWHRQDIMTSRLYLRHLTPRFDSSYPVLRQLPLPFRYVRP